MSAYHPKADIAELEAHVRFVPKADSCSANKVRGRAPAGSAMDFLSRGHMLADVSEILESLDIVLCEIDC